MNKVISIDADVLLDDYMFQATRYIVGRNSYITSNAIDYLLLIDKNRDKFNEDRLKFFASDIRENISNQVKFFRNVHVENHHNSTCKYDAYSLIVQACIDKGIKAHNTAKYVFFVDCYTGECKVEGAKQDYSKEYCFRLDIDLPKFISLANSIDRQKEITIKVKDKERKVKCFESYDGDIKQYHPLSNPRCFIDPSVIVDE